jgi:hypothetical protein
MHRWHLEVRLWGWTRPVLALLVSQAQPAYGVLCRATRAVPDPAQSPHRAKENFSRREQSSHLLRMGAGPLNLSVQIITIVSRAIIDRYFATIEKRHYSAWDGWMPDRTSVPKAQASARVAFPHG